MRLPMVKLNFAFMTGRATYRDILQTAAESAHNVNFAKIPAVCLDSLTVSGSVVACGVVNFISLDNV